MLQLGSWCLASFLSYTIHNTQHSTQPWHSVWQHELLFSLWRITLLAAWYVLDIQWLFLQTPRSNTYIPGLFRGHFHLDLLVQLSDYCRTQRLGRAIGTRLAAWVRPSNHEVHMQWQHIYRCGLLHCAYCIANISYNDPSRCIDISLVLVWLSGF